MESTASVAVIVPALNEAERIAATLQSLREGSDIIAEIVLVDGGGTDETVPIAKERGARVISAPRGRGCQFAAGIAASSAPFLLLLHADTCLAPGWAGPVRALIEAGSARAHYGRLRFDSADPCARIIEALAGLRCAVFRLPYGDQALLIPRALLDAVGGVPDLPLMEDVALARRLGRRNLGPMRVIAITDAAAYRRDGWFRRALSNLWRLIAFSFGAEPAGLAARYRR